MRPTFSALIAVALIVLAPACTPRESTAPAANASAPHEHTAPHGGTPVVLGREAYHLELVRDAAAGTLSLYVLDGEMEKFIRIKAPALEVTATVAGENRPLLFKAVANPATGETVGDTAQFDAAAEWLKTVASFDATLTTVEIRGTTFDRVTFNFPQGNEAP